MGYESFSEDFYSAVSQDVRGPRGEGILGLAHRMDLWEPASSGTLDSQRSATKGISLLLGLAPGQEKSPKGPTSSGMEEK